MGESIEYTDVLQEVRGAMNPGRLKLQSSSIIFKNIKTGKMDQFQANEVSQAKWLVRARGHCLKIMLRNGNIHRFDGIKESEFDKLSAFISKHYDTRLEKTDLSLKGWNWGTAKFTGNALNFEVERHPAFEIPLGNVSHTATLKNEVTLEFHQNDDAAVSLMELRFHIPSSQADGDLDPVQEFYKNVLASADVIQATGDAIAIFQEVQCVTPRGRYDIKIYPSFLQLHGKTFDYKIPYTTILRLFLLPHRDNRQMFFVVSLDPPIKQGQTRYPFLILLFNKEEETTIELELSEKEINENYEGKLTKSMSGPEYEIISRIFKALVNRKITVPGTFIGNSGMHSIACSYKAATGFLYPLERGFIFVHKPPLHIRFDEVSSVNFARSSGNTRSFDFEVDTKTGGVFIYVGIEKDEYGKLYDFVTQKKLRVKNIGGKMVKDQKGYNDEMVASDDDGEHDAYLERMKKEGKERDDYDDEDSDDSDDESFAPDGSGSDVAEEYDSNVSSTDSDDESGSGGSDDEETKKRKEKKKKEKEKKKARSRPVREGAPRKRKQKKDKDPDRPKRAATGYMIWLAETRESIKEEFPGISIIELTKKAGEMWREMKDKTKYEELAAIAKEEYQAAMEVYKEKLKDRSPPSSPKAKSPKKATAKKSPKKPTGDTKAGSGTSFKSREFIPSSDGSNSSEDDEDKPKNSSSDEDKPLKKKAAVKPAKKQKKEKKESKDEEEPMEEDNNDNLPADEEILSTPPSSGKEDSGSDSGEEEEDDE